MASGQARAIRETPEKGPETHTAGAGADQYPAAGPPAHECPVAVPLGLRRTIRRECGIGSGCGEHRSRQGPDFTPSNPCAVRPAR